MKYFIIDFGWNGRMRHNSAMTHDNLESICIKGMRMPSYAEAKEFCLDDMERLGCNCVTGVHQISHAQAEDEYDLSNEEYWPVFAEDEYEDWGQEGMSR